MDTLIAKIGHNAPPSPVEEAVAPFDDFIIETANWLDGGRVETEAQMKVVDALIKGMKSARKAVDDARDTATKPLNEAWKAEIAYWKPTQDDLDMQIKGLVALVDGFKRQLAADKEVARKAAWALAEKARHEAEAKTAAADVSNLEAQREARAAMETADLARAQATVAQKDIVKGMRTVTRYRLVDPVQLARNLWVNDRAAQNAFHVERATKLGLNLPGIFEKYTDREAY